MDSEYFWDMDKKSLSCLGIYHGNMNTCITGVEHMPTCLCHHHHCHNTILGGEGEWLKGQGLKNQWLSIISSVSITTYSPN